MASGEMSSAEYVRFLGLSLNAAASVSREGALHYVCTDWRHIPELLAAAKPVYGETINIAVWVKSNAGQGSFYRSQHELVGIFRVGQAPHRKQCRARAAWAFALERVALRRSELLPGRPHGGAARASVHEAGPPGGRRHQGLHAARRCRAGHLRNRLS
jgi:hypothetical protein